MEKYHLKAIGIFGFDKQWSCPITEAGLSDSHCRPGNSSITQYSARSPLAY